MKENILEGLKFAISKGDSLQEAMQSFYNAGYSREDIEYAARELQDQFRTEQIKGIHAVGPYNANPKAEGHTLIIPKFHYATLLDIPSNLAGEMLDLIKKLSKNPKLSNSFNLLVNNSPAAGQAIMHAHIHLIPRKEGDGLRSLA